MRVTFNSIHQEATAGLARSNDRLIEYQKQVSSGLRITKPSDDPSATATTIVERAGIATTERYTRASDSVSSRLSVVDTVLDDLINKLTAAQTAIMTARGTTATPATRDAAAQELLSLRDAVLDDLNTRFRDTYVFGGQAATTKPFQKNPDGTIAGYAGTTGEVAVDIDEHRSVTIAFNGDLIAQGADAADVFATFDAAVTAVRAGNEAGLESAMQAFQRTFSRATEMQSRVGAGQRAVDDQKLRLSETKTAMAARVSKLEHANMAEAITGMSQADAAYQAALGAAGKITRLSLMDYLR